MRGCVSCPISTRSRGNKTTFTIYFFHFFSFETIVKSSHTGALIGARPDRPHARNDPRLCFGVPWCMRLSCGGSWRLSLCLQGLAALKAQGAWFLTALMSGLPDLRFACADLWRCLLPHLEMGEQRCAPHLLALTLTLTPLTWFMRDI